MSTPICPKCGTKAARHYQGGWECRNWKCAQIAPFYPPPDNAAPEPITKHESLLGVPKEILISANHVSNFMAMNGHEDWELSGVADRKLVVQLRIENTRLVAENERQALLLDSGETQIARLRSQLAEKEREIEELKEEVARISQLESEATIQARRDANRADANAHYVSGLRAEIEELKKDKARLDFFHTDPAAIFFKYQSFPAKLSFIVRSTGAEYPTIREAIDAATKENP